MTGQRASDGRSAVAHPLRYLGAHFAKSQLWHASCLLFAFFLTESCGVAPGTMGWLLGGALVVNGLMDLAVGWRFNGRIADARRAGRLQAMAAPGIALCFLLFTLTPLLPAGWRLCWVAATLVGLRALYPLLDVAQNALVAMMTADPLVQRRLLAARNVASSLAALAIAAIAAPLLIAGQEPWGYMLWSGGTGGLLWLTAARLNRGLADTRDREPQSEGIGTSQARAPRRFVAVLAALVVMMIASTIFRTMEPYFAAFASHRLAMLVWSSIGAILSQPIWLAVIRRRGIARALTGMAVAMLCAGGLLVGPMRISQGGGVAIGLLHGAGSSGLWLVLWSIMTQAAAPGRALRYVGSFTCVSKLSQAAGMVLVGQILSASPYADTLADPASLPARAMVAALAVMAAVALVLAGYERVVSRTASAGTAATPPPGVRSVPAPAPRPAAGSVAPADRSGRAGAPPATTLRRRSPGPARAARGRRR